MLVLVASEDIAEKLVNIAEHGNFMLSCLKKRGCGDLGDGVRHLGQLIELANAQGHGWEKSLEIFGLIRLVCGGGQGARVSGLVSEGESKSCGFLFLFAQCRAS